MIKQIRKSDLIYNTNTALTKKSIFTIKDKVSKLAITATPGFKFILNGVDLQVGNTGRFEVIPELLDIETLELPQESIENNNFIIDYVTLEKDK